MQWRLDKGWPSVVVVVHGKSWKKDLESSWGKGGHGVLIGVECDMASGLI